MRIIFLNVWHGQAWDLFSEFIKSEALNTDIFCFTEVSPVLHEKISKIFVGHQPFYAKIRRTNYLGGVMEGQSIFVKKNIKVISEGKEILYRITKNDAGCLQYVEIETEKGDKIFIGNVHGKARPGEKLDTPSRLNQSKKLIQFFENKEGEKIIGGDFNLMPETKSVKMFSKFGYRDLINDFQIKNTRNRLSWEHFNNIQHFADYAFVTKGIKIKSFEVPHIEISDHLPLILEIEI